MATSARLEELMKKFDESPRRYFAPLANEYRKLGDLSQAITICRTHLPNQPGHVSGHIVLAQALYESGEFGESRVSFESALDLDPENLIALRYLGDIAREQGDIGTARGWYERVLDADPRNDEISALLSTLSAASAASATQEEDFATAEPWSSASATVDTTTPDVRESHGSAPTPPPPALILDEPSFDAISGIFTIDAANSPVEEVVAPESSPAEPALSLSAEPAPSPSAVPDAFAEAFAEADAANGVRDAISLGDLEAIAEPSDDDWFRSPTSAPTPQVDTASEAREESLFPDLASVTPVSSPSVPAFTVQLDDERTTAAADEGLELQDAIATSAPEAALPAASPESDSSLPQFELSGVNDGLGADEELPTYEARRETPPAFIEREAPAPAPAPVVEMEQESFDLLLDESTRPTPIMNDAIPEESVEDAPASPAVAYAEPSVDPWAPTPVPDAFAAIADESPDVAEAQGVESFEALTIADASHAGIDAALDAMSDAPADSAPVDVASEFTDTFGWTDAPLPEAVAAPAPEAIAVPEDSTADEVVSAPAEVPVVSEWESYGESAFGRTPELEHAAPEPTPTTFVTETMAELYVQQGFLNDALAIYRQLLAQSPEDETLRSRIASLERGEGSPAGDAAVAPRVDREGQSARAFFSFFAHREPRRTAPPDDRLPFADAGAPAGGSSPAATIDDTPAWLADDAQPAAVHVDAVAPEAPVPVMIAEPMQGEAEVEHAVPEEREERYPGAAMNDEALTVPDSHELPVSTLESLFGGDGISQDDEAAAGTLAAAFSVEETPPAAPVAERRVEELSLQHLFRDVPERSSGPVTLDAFFSGGSSGSAAPPPSGAPVGEERADIEQFTAWLEGLKKK